MPTGNFALFRYAGGLPVGNVKDPVLIRAHGGVVQFKAPARFMDAERARWMVRDADRPTGFNTYKSDGWVEIAAVWEFDVPIRDVLTMRIDTAERLQAGTIFFLGLLAWGLKQKSRVMAIEATIGGTQTGIAIAPMTGGSELDWLRAQILAEGVSGQDLAPELNLTTRATKRCPDCAEDVLAEARICRFCRFAFSDDAPGGE